MTATAAEPHAFRAACAAYPTGVLVVTASLGGDDFATTANAFTALSADPPLVIVCLAQTSATGTAVRRAGTFGLNVLAHHQGDVARSFARAGAQELAELAFRRGHGGAPLLADAAAWFQCEVAEVLPRATHVLMIGRVLAADHADREPLVYHRSDMFDPIERRRLEAGHPPRDSAQ